MSKIVPRGTRVRMVGGRGAVGHITGIQEYPYDRPVRYFVQWAVNEPSHLVERSAFRVIANDPTNKPKTD